MPKFTHTCHNNIYTGIKPENIKWENKNGTNKICLIDRYDKTTNRPALFLPNFWLALAKDWSNNTVQPGSPQVCKPI